MQKQCAGCGSEFTVRTEELEYYANRVFVPPPTLCPDCRKRRRLTFRNERKFYHGNSALSGKPIVSIYSPESPYTVFEYDEWWTDAYNPLDYGRDYDFSRPFFEQFNELLLTVPQMALVGSQNENCPYCHLLANCRNCYMIIESSNNEDCYYCYWIQKCIGCCDCSFCHECSYCYELDNCYNCYNLAWSRNCTNCTDSAFLENCIGCRNCFGCTNLQQKEYWLFNEPVGREAYEAYLQAAKVDTRSGVAREREKAARLAATLPKKYAQILNSESSSGDYIVSSKNCRECYHAHDAEECTYAEHVWRDSRWNMDVSTAGRNAELIYESLNVGIDSYNVQFCIQGWSSHDLRYCIGAFNSNHCFGCVGMKRNEYCLLNKQYTKDDYNLLVKQITEAMTASGEFGEFFPPQMSPFGYNETVANEYFPLDRTVALTQGYRWSDFETPKPVVKRTMAAGDVPDSINDAPPDLTASAVICPATSRPFRLIQQELSFYRRNGFPIPIFHPDERHAQRMKLRNPQTLHPRSCALCSADVLSTYSAECPENVYCEQCFSRSALA